MKPVMAYIGLGANLGDPVKTVQQAVRGLNLLAQTRVHAQSSLFRTAPVDAGGDDYINAVVCVETTLSALDLLQQLQAVEQAHGRERLYHNAPRTLDLDILLYDQDRIANDRLTVPHPRMTQRAFVLIPLLQIDPFISIPGLGPAHHFVPGVADQLIHKLP
jgi:2-amino-4-hydroxy-6-hydroxymethyldihydropteridine diphosphokinase